MTQIGPLHWSYLLSVATPSANTLRLAELDTTPGLAYMLFDVWADSGSAEGTPSARSLKRIPPDGEFVVPQSPPPPIPGHSDGGTYQVLAPIMANGASYGDVE